MGLLGKMFNNVYVRWKILLGLGTGFWILLCLYDTYLVDPVTKGYYSEPGDFAWLAQVAEEEIMPEGVPRKDDIQFPEENYGLGFYLVLWNILTFFITFVACTVGKSALVYWWQYRNSAGHTSIPELIEQPSKKSINSSKIPVLCGSKSATSATLDNIDEISEKEGHIASDIFFLKAENEAQRPFLRASSTSIDLMARHSKSDLSSRHEQQMEKQCAKLRDEMIYIQASSLKEHAALSRKLELVTKEKRDLCRQLLVAQKENRAAKMQLEELLSEKSMLLKRLECASKEFKSNTKSKKQALAKLEDSQATIASLKQELEKIAKEKELLKNKIQLLESEYRVMKDRLVKYEKPSDKFGSSDSKPIRVEHKEDSRINQAVSNLSKDFKKCDIAEISQSQRDVQRVQLRLINLEKSLDKLKFGHWGVKNDDDKPSELYVDSELKTRQEQSMNAAAQSESDDQEFQHSSNLISTLSENPLEEQTNRSAKLPAQCDNLTDEQRRKILSPADSSGDEYSTTSKRCDNNLENYRHIDDPFERAGNILNFLKSTSSPRVDIFDLSGSDIPIHETSTSINEDEDTDEWEPPKTRFVSNSAAFKKFLKSMDCLDKNQQKFAVS